MTYTQILYHIVLRTKRSELIRMNNILLSFLYSTLRVAGGWRFAIAPNRFASLGVISIKSFGFSVHASIAVRLAVEALQSEWLI